MDVLVIVICYTETENYYKAGLLAVAPSQSLLSDMRLNKVIAMARGFCTLWYS